jgi:hypothetical protein
MVVAIPFLPILIPYGLQALNTVQRVSLLESAAKKLKIIDTAVWREGVF